MHRRHPSVNPVLCPRHTGGYVTDLLLITGVDRIAVLCPDTVLMAESSISQRRSTEGMS